jgi:aspartate racemase
VTPEARAALYAEAEKLVEKGAQGVILGCTEIPLALTEPNVRDVPLLDATKVLARALIVAFAPDRLKKEA